MRAVLQRVQHAQVVVDGNVVGKIGHGFLVLLGVGKADTEDDARYLAGKIAGMRIFSDAEGKFNLALADIGGAVLLVSQFTLLGNTKSGRRPGFEDAAPPEDAKRWYEEVAAALKAQGTAVETGVFAAHMKVELVNDGPVTFLLDSRGAISAVS